MTINSSPYHESRKENNEIKTTEQKEHHRGGSDATILVGAIAGPLSITYQRSRSSTEVLDDWRLADATLICKNGCKEEPGIYRSVSLTLVPGKVMDTSS